MTRSFDIDSLEILHRLCGLAALRLCVGIFLLSIAVVAQTPVIEKVEPPNWWAGHSINPLRVMVRGLNFQNARIASKNSGLKASNIRVNQRGDYLFFDLAVAKTMRPGKYALDLSSVGGKTNIPFEISEPLPKTANFQGVDYRDVIYLIMTDRFSDGDAANNKDVDRKNPRAWHGGDFRGIINRLDYLKELGITTMWLTPWYDNPDGANQCDKPWCPNTNYHGYHAIDYYGVENHFGTMADLQQLVREAHKKGIKVVQDQVANHVGIQHPWAKNPPLENWFSPFSANTFNNSVLLSPNASQAERDNLLKGWFNELLPDLNQTEPEVSLYLIQNALWWIGMTGIDGIRQDTIQYMPREFIRDWSAAILKQYPNYYMVGEIFEEDSAQTAFFQGGKIGWDGIDTNLPSVFDFRLWRTSQEVFTGKKPARALRDILKYDGLYPNINNVTTLTNNHDTDRFMSLPGATPEGAMMHVAFMLSTRGIPQLYYGEEIAMTGGHDPDNRKDFSGGFPGDSRDLFTKAGRTAVQQELFKWIQAWIALRSLNKALQNGRVVDLVYQDGLYIFARDKSCRALLCEGSPFIFAFNTSSETQTIDISLDELISKNGEKTNLGTIRTVLKVRIGETQKEIEQKNGTFRLQVRARSAVAYEADSMIVETTE